MLQNEIKLVLNGKTRDYFLDLKFPEFDVEATHKVTLDLLLAPANLVPLRYENGEDFFVQGPYFGPSTMMCVFKLYGDDIPVDEQMKVIGAWTHELNLDHTKYHTSMRALSSPKEERMRTFIYRIYANVEGECFEHPEMLTGAPIGMYHCPECMFMVIAGVPHPTKAQIEDFENGISEDDDANFEGEDPEMGYNDPPYTQAQVDIMNVELHKERTRKELFNEKFRLCQSSFEAYARLSDNWDGAGAPKPNPAAMQNAFNFMMFVSDCADLENARAPFPTLSVEGAPGIFWPAQDDKNYVALSFLDDRICYFVKELDGTLGNSGALVLGSEGSNIEEKLLEIINVWPNQMGV